ncbi:hypothetical protein EIN_205760 [Entamoeba invadens IP1]|uniref:Uncharacterized protein n=1 Tax=Entamoeba invadens IP1 TaxID=370355 RepID=A0A0A1U9M2_ENTIV|nr:hypothetical protein EIN_205760 [Entamoeba invadens IP1]ELP91619.1 hypothetical protein EIN_205760 [Entamoeba invadens IP1]|eukprot:XP_004258390.1 hypothetical protein EIN_205760 [Entamoeba invadens IP1]
MNFGSAPLSITTLKERERKEHFTYQQSLLIALLNQHAKVTIKRPKKYSTHTSTIPMLFLIEVESSKIDVIALATKRCDLIKKDETAKGIPVQTVKRRFNKNVSAFLRNFLFDACFEFGFFFESKMSKNSMKSIQSEYIQNIYYNGCLIYTKDNILDLGKRIHCELMEKLTDKRTTSFELGELNTKLENYNTTSNDT